MRHRKFILSRQNSSGQITWFLISKICYRISKRKLVVPGLENDHTFNASFSYERKFKSVSMVCECFRTIFDHFELLSLLPQDKSGELN